MATRLLWMVFAPFEFLLMIIGGAFLYLIWAALIYLDALRGLFERAIALAVLRFRAGRISSLTNGRNTTSPLPEASAHGPVERGSFHSWLN
jgi:hypothetical protein